MTFQKSQTICHLEWENVGGCSQFWEGFFLFICFYAACRNQVIWIWFTEEKTINILLITWLSSRDADANLGTSPGTCTFVSPLTQWNILSVLTASLGWTPKLVKIYCTKSVVEMLPFYRDTQDIFLPVLIAADDLHNCYHIWYTPQYITLFVLLKVMKWWKLKSCGIRKLLHMYYLTLDYWDFFLGKGQQGLICGG